MPDHVISSGERPMPTSLATLIDFVNESANDAHVTAMRAIPTTIEIADISGESILRRSHGGDECSDRRHVAAALQQSCRVLGCASSHHTRTARRRVSASTVNIEASLSWSMFDTKRHRCGETLEKRLLARQRHSIVRQRWKTNQAREVGRGERTERR